MPGTEKNQHSVVDEPTKNNGPKPGKTKRTLRMQGDQTEYSSES